ncbi:acylphosphatase [Candidatus Bathyarchaeota archaeon RBG_16_48_13]|nr:MAG: acylphosphatase [Candidatus Bathyarchaeota archaeon RBG_16_48_13]
MNVRVHLLIEGKVQGVFFRNHTKEKAIQEGVYGWVKNLPDGRVETIFEGDHLAIQRIIEFCSTGPGGSNVTKVEVTNEKYLGDFDNFSVKY